MSRHAVVSVNIPFSASKKPSAVEGPLVAGSDTKHRYMHVLEQECAGAFSLLEDYEVRAIHVGGGSPSAMRPDDIAHLLRLLRSHATFSHPFEISMEVLPQTVGTPCMDGMKGGGVSRMHLHVPSIDDEDLVRLGCGFTFADIQTALSFSGKFRIDGFDPHVMYGIPGQAESSLRRTLGYVLACGADSVTLVPYCGSPEDAEVDPASEALARARTILERADYRQCAPACYARPGREPLLTKTDGCDVFGFGLGAVSHIGGIICTNTAELQAYLASEGSYDRIVAKVERLPA